MIRERTSHPATIFFRNNDLNRSAYFRVRASKFGEFGVRIYSEPSNVLFVELPSAGKQTYSTLSASDGLPEYYLWLPTNHDASRKWPILVYFHDTDAIGGPPSSVKSKGPPKLLEENNAELAILRENFIVISPHMASGGTELWWDPSRQNPLLDILDTVTSKFYGDPAKTILAGEGLGGDAAITVCSRVPHYFSACLAVSARMNGLSDESQLFDTLTLPIWVHHGNMDSVVPYTEAEDLVNFLSQFGSFFYEMPFDPLANVRL